MEPMEFEAKSDNRILAISIAYEVDRTRSYFPVTNDLNTGEIQFQVPVVPNGALSRMVVAISIPPSARIEPAFRGLTDLSRPYRFSVIAENGEVKEYLIVAYN